MYIDSKIDLKPCPFCGQAARLKKIFDHNRGMFLYVVSCDNSLCLMAPETTCTFTQEECIEYWNTRYNNG